MGGGVQGSLCHGFHVAGAHAATGRLGSLIIRQQVQSNASHGSGGMSASVAGRVHQGNAGESGDNPAVGSGNGSVFAGGKACDFLAVIQLKILQGSHPVLGGQVNVLRGGRAQGGDINYHIVGLQFADVQHGQLIGVLEGLLQSLPSGGQCSASAASQKKAAQQSLFAKFFGQIDHRFFLSCVKVCQIL